MKRLLLALGLFSFLGISSQVFATDSFKIVNNTAGPWHVGDSINFIIYAMNGGAYASDYFGTVTLTASSGSGTFSPVATGNFNGAQWAGNITFRTAGNITLTCAGGSFTGNTQLALAALPATQLLICIPGQTLTPGLSPGITPAVPTVFAGVLYPVTVYAVDNYWNIDTQYAGQLNLSSVSATINPPGYQTVANGQKTFDVTFTMTGSNTLQCNTPTAYSQYVNVISASQAWCFLAAPTQITAGVPFALTATVSTSQNDPTQVFPGNADHFNIMRYTSGTTTAAPGNWGPIDNFSAVNGRFTDNKFTYDKVGSIYLRADKSTGDPNINVTGVNTIPITVLANVPGRAADKLQVSISPAQVQAQHQAIITASVLDAFGNPTSSRLRQFTVLFEQTQGNGYLSVTQAATDDLGIATTTFTGGNVNETAQILVSVKDDFLGTMYNQQTATISVSVAKAEPGSILNYPNPFNPAANQTTAVNYYLEQDSNVELKIYDPFGRVVFSKNYSRDASEPEAMRATHQGGAIWVWDGKNGENRIVANGIYFLKIIAKGSSKTQEFKRRVGVLK